MEKNLTCIVCPSGCKITVIKIDSNIEVSGNICPRGEKYAIEEITNPKRKIPTTVKIRNAFLKRLPVITKNSIPKDMIFEVMKKINKVKVVASIKIGDVIIKDILDTGVDIVATRSMESKNSI